MALTRKLLKSMGIEDEKIDQIIEAHTETVDALKNERDHFREVAEKLPDVQKQLDAAQKANSGDESYKTKYDALKEDFEKYKGEVSAKETKGAKENALRAILKKVGVLETCIDSIVEVTNLDNIELDKDGNVINPDALEESSRKKWESFIPTTGEIKPTPETPPTNSGGKAAFDAMSLSERMKFANEHPAEAAAYMT